MGKSSYGWFMGFKLHLIINNHGEIMAIKITAGNKSDLSQAKALAKDLQGKMYGDKGYISKNLFEKLYNLGLRFQKVHLHLHHLHKQNDRKVFPFR
jgi:hypothetical protein